MFSLHINFIFSYSGNWIINLSVLLCNFQIIISQSCDSNNETNSVLPFNWPCHWNNGIVPFVFNFYSHSPKRLMSLVHKGHSYIEERSCLTFKEDSPIKLAHMKNFTYLFYTYSGVLESCCLRFFTKPVGRRLVLITPTCTLPAEVAHSTLHGLGLNHQKHERFSEFKTRAVMFPRLCQSVEEKMAVFDRSL